MSYVMAQARGQQTFPEKDQIINISGFAGMWSVSQLFNFAIAEFLQYIILWSLYISLEQWFSKC